jgi:hypothetical protein
MGENFASRIWEGGMNIAYSKLRNLLLVSLVKPNRSPGALAVQNLPHFLTEKQQ